MISTLLVWRLTNLAIEAVICAMLYLKMAYLSMATERHNERGGNIYKNVPEINQYMLEQESSSLFT